MAIKENVIHLNLRRQKQSKKQSKKSENRPAAVVDMTERREEMVEQERRRVRRTILSEFIGVHVVVPNRGLMPVTLYDISAGGVSFDVTANEGRFRIGDQLAMRVYLNHKTYFSFLIQVANVRQERDQTEIRHGANFVKGSTNEVALGHFVRFIETVSANLQTDGGDVTVNKLTNIR